MSVQIVQKSIKFFSELVNGPDFDLNTDQFTTTLSDSVTGKCKSEITVEIEAGIRIANWQFLHAGTNINNEYKIVKADATFLSDGFFIGGEIRINVQVSFNTTISGDVIRRSTFFHEPNFIVTSLTNTEIFVTYTGGNDISLMVNGGSAFPEWGNDIASYIDIEPNFTALEFAYNLIENSAGNASLTSELTNSTNITKVRGVPTVTGQPAVVGVPSSANQAWVMGDVSVQFTAKVFNSNTLSQILFGNRYVITHEFTIPYYFDGEDDNLENPTTAPDLYDGTSSPKYIYKTTWLADIDDPNTGVSVTYSASRGNSGYLNEAFNGDANPYTVSDLVYFDVTEGITTDRLNIGKITRVSFNVTNSENDFIMDQAVVAVHGAIVNSDQYGSSTADFNTVWTFETERTTGTAPALDGATIKNYTLNLSGSSLMAVSFDVEFTALQNNVIEEGQFYILAIQLRDDNVTAASPIFDWHKVHLLIDYNQYGINNDIPGLFGVARFEQIPHPNVLDSNVTDTVGYTNGQYNNEEGALSLVEFWLDTSKQAKLEELKFKIGVFNTNTAAAAFLRETIIDLSDARLIGDVWQLRLNSTVGYPLKEGDQFNLKRLITGDLVGSKQFYTLLIGYRMPWQEWLSFVDAPSEFFNIDQPNDGLNQKSSNYSGNINDYQIRLFIDAKASQDGINTDYLTSSNEIKVFNYDEDDSPGNDTYTCDIGTFNAENTPLENNIIEEGYTLLKATFTPLVTPTFSAPVDFNDFRESSTKFAHGSKCSIPIGGGQFTQVRLNGTAQNNVVGTWANEQAGVVEGVKDTFMSSPFNVLRLDKDDVDALYTTTSNTIIADANMSAFYGMASSDKLEYYEITGEMFSNAADNDVIAFNIAFHVDDFGVESTLSLMATTGGVLLDIDPAYDQNTPENLNQSTIKFSPTTPNDDEVNWALVYNFGKKDCKKLDVFYTGLTKAGTYDWNELNQTTETFVFEVKRSGNSLTIKGDWNLPVVGLKTNTFNFDLIQNPDNELTEKFIGPQSYGFSFMSQDLGGFKNVVLNQPTEDFWAANRIETENNRSDNGLFELSTDIEGNATNLLKQINPASPILSTIDWDGTSFVVQSLINTDRVVSGEQYRLSSEIGSTNLGVLNLLTTFAWVDSDNPTILRVMFNTSVDIVDLTGLSLTGTTVTITSLIGASDNFISFDLSAEIPSDSLPVFNYSVTNITSSTGALSAGSISIFTE